MSLRSALKKPSHFRVDQADLLCKNQCGYYGNPSWKGYCSKCYRDLYQKTARQGNATAADPRDASATRRAAVTAVAVAGSPGSISAFSKFEEKKKLQEKGVASVRSLLKKQVMGTSRESSPLPKDAIASSPILAFATATSPQSSSGDSHAFGEEFVSALRRLDQPLADRLRSRTAAMLARFRDLQPLGAIEDWSDIVQDFYQDAAELLSQAAQSSIATGLSEELEQAVLDSIESSVTQYIYSSVFCPSSDEDADLKLHKRIRSLHWVTDKQLEANLAAAQDLGVRATLESAMTEIIQMDAQKSPKEKLHCIVECSRAIFAALHRSRIVTSNGSLGSSGSGSSAASSATLADSSAVVAADGTVAATPTTAAASPVLPVASSADDFLPAFIYIILKSNPPRLQSNISYITRFANPARLNRGEGGYFFTNLCCVVDFIRMLNAESLNLSQEEFDAYMSGQRMPEDGCGIGGVCASLYMCDGLRLMHENLMQLDDLRRRTANLESVLAEHSRRSADAAQQFDAALDAVLDTTCPLAPHREPWRRHKVNPDADVGGAPPPQLPEPLLPQPAAAISAPASSLQQQQLDGTPVHSCVAVATAIGVELPTSVPSPAKPACVDSESAAVESDLWVSSDVQHLNNPAVGTSCGSDLSSLLSGKACEWEAMLDAMEVEEEGAALPLPAAHIEQQHATSGQLPNSNGDLASSSLVSTEKESETQCIPSPAELVAGTALDVVELQ